MTRSAVLMSILALVGATALGNASWRIAVDEMAVVGVIKPVSAVNGGPSPRIRGPHAAWRQARIPFGRTHDMNHSWEFGGPHTIDVDAVFPDFEADENDPANYDFFYTDQTLDALKACGIEPFYRLGPSIEGGLKKYHTHPPKDFAKWARICEHIILHCNEGWANGHRRGIRYWEIWFEPDIGANAWTGTREQFLELFKTAAIHLKSRFPKLKIGGPAFAEGLAWKELFLPFCRRENVPLDFYSWHCYTNDARLLGNRTREVRALLDANGFTATESVCDEWNYVRGWKGEDWAYSRQVESGAFVQKGAAFAAAALSVLQDAPVDLAMYYDTRTYGGMNMLFDPVGMREMKGYYPFYAWGKLLNDYGTEVRATVSGDSKPEQLFVTAAKDVTGRLAVWIARFSDDNNVIDRRRVEVRLGTDRAVRPVICHMTDDHRLYTETPLERSADGTLALTVSPNAFVFLEEVK